jgi:hypothetical protein
VFAEPKVPSLFPMKTLTVPLALAMSAIPSLLKSWTAAATGDPPLG